MAQDPLQLLREFISAAGALEIVPQVEYSAAVQTLCEKAPVVARSLADEILKHFEGDEEETEEPEVSAAPSRKRTKTADPTYRPPKSSRAGKVPAQGSPPDSGGSLPERGQCISSPKALSPTKAAGEADPGLSLKELQDLGAPSAAQDGLAVVHGRDTELIAPITHEPERVVSSTTPTLSGRSGFAATAPSLQVARFPTTPPGTTPVLTHTTDTDGPAAFPPEQGKQGGIRSTPEAQIGLREQASPQTEEIPRGNGSTLPFLRLESPSPRPALEDFTFEEFLGEMIGVIAAMSMYREQAPPGAYSAILSSLPAGRLLTTKDAEVAPPGSIWTTDAKDWSGQMWIHFLEAGEGRSRKTTVLNMIGYMGASVWYDTKLAEFQAPLTKSLSF